MLFIFSWCWWKAYILWKIPQVDAFPYLNFNLLFSFCGQDTEILLNLHLFHYFQFNSLELIKINLPESYLFTTGSKPKNLKHYTRTPIWKVLNLNRIRTSADTLALSLETRIFICNWEPFQTTCRSVSPFFSEG